MIIKRGLLIMAVELIDNILKRFKNEYVIIRILTTDKHNEPLAGELIGHTPDYHEMVKMRSGLKCDVLTEWTGQILEPGYEVILHGDF
jgi:hypothetical protein